MINYINLRVNASETTLRVTFFERLKINFYSILSHANFLPIQNKLKHIKSSDECVIIGNGPSLNKVDWKKVSSFDTFGVNSIFLLKEKMNFIPKFYVVEDVYVADDRKEEINKNKNGVIEIYPNYLKYLFGSKINSVFVNVFFYYGRFFKPRIGRSIDHGLFVGGSVSHLCIQIAIHLGYSKIHLIGFDHNYVINPTVETKGKKLVSTKNDDNNHFDKTYFGKGKRWHEPDMDRMKESHDFFNMVAKKRGINIYNTLKTSGLSSYEIKDENSFYKK